MVKKVSTVRVPLFCLAGNRPSLQYKSVHVCTGCSAARAGSIADATVMELLPTGCLPGRPDDIAHKSMKPPLPASDLPPTSTAAHELRILYSSPSVLVVHKPAGLPLDGKKPKTALSILSELHKFDKPPRSILCPPRPVSGPIIFSLDHAQSSSAPTFILHAITVCSPEYAVQGATLLKSSPISSPAGPLQLLRLSSSDPGSGLRKRLREAGSPVLGDALLSGVPGRGLYLAISRVEMPTLGIIIDCPLPPKFSTLVERESRLEKRRRDRHAKEERARYDHESGETRTKFLNWYFFASGAMTPRKSSECVAEAAADLLKDSFIRRTKQSESDSVSALCVPRLLDLGTGSGCLMAGALLLANLDAQAVGIELSEEAAAVATRNIQSLDLSHFAKIVKGDFGTIEHVLEPDELGFDVVITNPPYLTRKEIELDIIGLAQDPELALLSQGGDGLGSYRAIASCLRRSPSILRYDGHVVLEVGGTRSAGKVREIFEQVAKLCFVELRLDERGFERCLVLRSSKT